MIEILQMWWWAVSELWGWACIVIVPVAFYKTLNHVLDIRAMKKKGRA